MPRSPRVYEDWAGVLGMDRSADWIASCTLDAFVEALCARHAVDRMALLRRAGLDNGRGAAGAAEDYLCGAYACYSLAQSPYHRGRLIRGTLTIEPAARRAEGLVATYSQALATGRAHATGPATVAGRGLALGLVSHSPGAAPLFLHLLLPTPPASLLLGLMGGFVMVDPGGQPPYATRVLMLRTPIAAAALEESNRYLDEPDAAAALARDLPALGLRVADAEGLAAALARSLVPEGAGGAPPGSMRVFVEDYRALAAACDRVWLDTLAANGGHAGPMAIRRPVAAPDDARRAERGGDGTHPRRTARRLGRFG